MSLLSWLRHQNSFGNNIGYRFIALDPGTDTLGVAFCEIDLVNHVLLIHNVTTLRAAKMMTLYPDYIAKHGKRQTRLRCLIEALGIVYNYWQPSSIISEAPFMGKFAQAFGALVECMYAIRTSVSQYRKDIALETVEPVSAKKSVNVKAKGGTKEDVRIAVLSDPRIIFSSDCPADGHSEHVYDACAVAKWKFLKFLGEI